MFEKRLKEISEKLGGDSLKIYYVLSRKKHRREIYFENNQKSVAFIKIKFNSSYKKIAYFLIKLGILQPFLKKVKLSSKIGNVIFVGGQIKGFNLKKKTVISFPLHDIEKKDFVESKKIQKKFSKEGFAPNVLKLNKRIPFSVEELLKVYTGGYEEGVFKKLRSFYKKEGIEKTSIKKYVSFLLKRLKKMGVNETSLFKILKDFSKKKELLLISKIHGDFTREQILVKENSFVFTDWDSYEKELKKNLIIRDLVTFFRGETRFLDNKLFIRLLEIYPKEVKNNIKLYLILNEVYDVSRRNVFPDISKERIKNILKH